MKPLLIWLRRGVGAYLALVVFGFVLTSLLTQPDWRAELDWATRLTAASILIVCPCVAAVAAIDTSRRMNPTLVALSRGSTRRPAHIALPALAVVAWSGSAYVLVWAVAAGIVTARNGVGITDWWVFPEILAPLLGAGMLGLLIGMAITSRLAAPLAAVATLTANIVASPWGRGPLEAVTTYGTLTGLQRPAVRAVASIVGALIVALVALVAALQVYQPTRGRRVVLTGCAVALLAAAVVPAAWPWRQDVYVATGEPYGCIGSAPSVCGPKSRLPLLKPVQDSLAGAYRTLVGTDFTKPESFRVTRLDHYSDLDGAAPLDFDPAFIRHGSYDKGAVARALLRPQQCRELFSPVDSVKILDAQDRILPWLQAVLAGHAPARPAPAEVQSAFDVIQHCTPMTGNLH